MPPPDAEHDAIELLNTITASGRRGFFATIARLFVIASGFRLGGAPTTAAAAQAQRASPNQSRASTPRRITLLDEDWRFAKGDRLEIP